MLSALPANVPSAMKGSDCGLSSVNTGDNTYRAQTEEIGGRLVVIARFLSRACDRFVGVTSKTCVHIDITLV